MQPYLVKIYFYHPQSGVWDDLVPSDEKQFTYTPDYTRFDGLWRGGPFATLGEHTERGPQFQLKMRALGPILVSKQDILFNGERRIGGDRLIVIPLGLPSKHTFILEERRFDIETRLG